MANNNLPPEIFNRVMSYAGKRRNQVSAPHITANDAIKLADYLMTVLPAPKPKPVACANCDGTKQISEDGYIAVCPVCAPKAPTKCASNSDGECRHPLCPQLRDNEPNETGRSCPLFDWNAEYD